MAELKTVRADRYARAAFEVAREAQGTLQMG